MFKSNTPYLLFGNPIHQSKSPIIYQLFSKDTNIHLKYDTYCIKSDDSFSKIIIDFFNHQGKGANITVPFKEQAYFLPNILTERAKISHSINVLKKLHDNKILGDNTDGVGCLYDLKRLNFIHTENKILLIGAGGAARGIIPSLLSLPCSIDIVNRTFERAKKLENLFKNIGNIRAIDVSSLKKLNYHLVINATSFEKNENFDFFLSNIILYPARTFFYDICYCDNITPFLFWCKNNGAIYYSDGIGMLVSQAAYSFYLWNNIFPKVDKIIQILNKKKKYL
ncbi:shikimate dehydrogenase [Buchnera aphidicola]|uniref:shikimate dehydrogenase n=1 Tax=Buchnera aphidicola TaxID=9 RepID=UPI003463C744